MSTEQEAVKERRQHSHDKIQSLVHSRTQTLALYSELAAKQPFQSQPDINKLLQTFCQAIIDYTAGAHFTLYKYIDERKERRKAVLELAAEIYPKIVEVTQFIVDFNDKYDSTTHPVRLDQLASDLSRLGEALADRIEWEDQLIALLTKKRK